MDPPYVGPNNPLPPEFKNLGYFCAIGGEGRDYRLLSEVMKRRRDLRLVIVARRYSVSGLVFTDNVKIFTNLPSDVTWRLAADGHAVIVPLNSSRRSCGHITIVGSQLLGIPLIVSRSIGVEDYIEYGRTALGVAVGDAGALADALDMILDDPKAADERRKAAQIIAEDRSNLSVWLTYFKDLALRFEDREMHKVS
jgi:glycosyltransferase involved in cell wall biosynthesis